MLKATPVSESETMKVTFLTSPFARFSRPPRAGTVTVTVSLSTSSMSNLNGVLSGLTSHPPSTLTFTSTSSLKLPLFATVNGISTVVPGMTAN